VPRVGSLGEDALVAAVIAGFRSRSAQTAPAWLTVGPGDDAAVIDIAALSAGGSLVATTDTLVEGQDFRQHWSSPADVGVKVAAQNFADIAAMGATPAVLLVSLAIPSSADSAFAESLAEGLDEECRRAGAIVAGGDVSEADAIVITGTALGVLAPGRSAVLRSGARPGDVVAVAGTLGRSAAGWALLEHGYRGTDGRMRDLIAAHQRPQPPYEAGPAAAAAGASAMIDTSDGLIRDATRITAASGVVIDLDSAALAPPADLERAAELLKEHDPAAWVLTGGEDHALLACFDPARDRPAAFVRIGQVRDGKPAVLLDGRPWTSDPGWRHFNS
jgi:thiamine-monophosphate kinase